MKVELAVKRPVPNSPYGLCRHKATVNYTENRAQELCESRGGHPGLPVPNSPYDLCGHKATANYTENRAHERCRAVLHRS